jgi:hypothetical protein
MTRREAFEMFRDLNEDDRTKVKEQCAPLGKSPVNVLIVLGHPDTWEE